MPTIADAAAVRRAAPVAALIDRRTRLRAGFVAAAAVALVAAAPPPAAGAAGWTAPVSGWVTRGFDLGPDPFERARHRGADFAAPPGAPVRAACGGRVLVAGRVGTNGRVVTIRCGAWRVTHLPLAAVSVRVGADVDRGGRIGSASASRRHHGLHLGVRREGDRFGYVDPLRFISRHPLPPPPLGAIPPRGEHPPAATPLGRPQAAPRPVQAPLARPQAAPRPVQAPLARPQAASGLAPWPAWVGLALLLAGAVGAGLGRPRRRRGALPRAAAQEVR